MAGTPLFNIRTPGGIQVWTDDPQPGTVWFVNSAASAASDATGSGRDPNIPFASLDYAVTQASAGDTIYLLPTHAETIEDSDEADITLARLKVIGLGQGTQRPTFTLGAATDATINITAAGVLLKNIRVISDFADVAAGITLAAGADGSVIEDCYFSDGAAAKELVIGISVAANCDDVTIQRCHFNTVAGGGCASAIKFVGATDRSVVRNCIAHGDYSVACIDGATAAGTLVHVADNALANVDAGAGLAVSLNASTTGIVANNSLFGAKANTTPLAATGAFVAENYCADSASESGALSPAATDFA